MQIFTNEDEQFSEEMNKFWESFSDTTGQNSEKDLVMRVNVLSAKRMRNTVNGNPVWKIETNHGTFKTKPDANWVSSIWTISTGPAEITIENNCIASYVAK